MSEDQRLSSSSFVRFGLTVREAGVLAGVARGETNEEIADGLYVSLLTVKTHLQHAYRKLGADPGSGAAPRQALKAGPTSGRARARGVRGLVFG